MKTTSGTLHNFSSLELRLLSFGNGVAKPLGCEQTLTAKNKHRSDTILIIERPRPSTISTPQRSTSFDHLYQNHTLSRMSQRARHHGKEGAHTTETPSIPASTSKPSSGTLIQQVRNRKPASSLSISPQHQSSASTITTEPTPSHTTALMTTLLYTPTLTIIHFTFHILVLHQYSQLGSSFTSLSSLLPFLSQVLRQYLLVYAILIYIAHTPFFPILHRSTVRDIVFTTGSVVAGCTLIRMTHRAPYLEMVEKAPVVATLWMWCVIEMSPGGYIVMTCAVGSFARWYGYGIR